MQPPIPSARHGLGRFISADWSAVPVPVPYANLGDPQTLNLYTYGRNLPTTLSDDDGHGLGTPDFVERKARLAEFAKLSNSEQNKQLAIGACVVLCSMAGVLAAPEAAAGSVLVRNLLGLGLATAPTTVPIAMDIIEGATPGAPGFSVRAAAETLGMRTLEKVGESGATGRLANGIELSAGFERAGSNLGVNISNIKASTAGSVNFHGLEAGAQRLAQQQGATSLTIRAVSVLNPMLARILRKAGYTAEKVTDKFGRETVDYVKTVPVRQPS